MGLLLPAFGRPGAWKRALAVMGMFVAVAILITGSPVPAAADERLLPVRIASWSSGGEAPADEAPEGPLTAADPITAMSIARLENEPVEVMSERTETTTVFALPDGTMAAGVASGPVRVLTDGDGLDPADWAATDETLSVGEDGIVRPAAHVGQLELSGGTPAGTPQDATVEVMAMTTADGTRSTLEWEGPLPAPRLEGARAVYEEVRPGIDMVVEATATGAEQFFVVKEPPAAGEDLVLPVGLSTQGAALAPTADGAIEVVDEAGEVVGRSLEPAMWDAAADADRVHPVSQPWEPLDAALRQPPAMPDWASARAAARSGARAPETPGDRRATPQASDRPDGRVPAFVDQVVVERNTEHVDADSVRLDLTPQQEFLTDPGTEYPVIVDPAFNVFAYFDTWVQSGYTGDLSANGELLIGTWDGGTTKTRAFANFENSSFAGATVLSAGLYLIEHHSASCTPRNWQVWGTGLATTATRWSNQPALVTHWGTSSATTGYSASCPDGQVGIDVKGVVTGAAAAPSGSVFTVALKAENETDNLGFKRFYSNESGSGPWIWLNYNFPPTAGGLRVSGAPNPATSGTWTNTLRPTLSATLSDNDGGALSGTFRLRSQGTTTNLWTGTVSNINSGATGAVQVPAGLLSDGQVYEFSVTGNDGSLTGPASSWFTFGVDVTAPLGPVVSSSTHGLVWGQTETGNGTFVATMKTPDAGVTAYVWGLDAAPDPNKPVTVTNGAPGTMTVNVATPGRHLLNVQSRDRAGNLSGIVTYGFYVGHGGLIGPDEGAQVVRRVRLTVDNDPTLPYVRFQWRRSPDIPESAAQVVASSHLTTSTGRPWPSSGWGTIPAAGGYTTWDAGQTLGFVGGPLQVRAQLAADTSGSQSSYTQWVTITVDPDADGAATTAIGPGSVNLLTGDHYLSATDAEEFGLALTRTASSRDTDAGYEAQSELLASAVQQASSLAPFVQSGAAATISSTRSHSGGTSLRTVPASPTDNTVVLVRDNNTAVAPAQLKPGHRYRVSAWVYVESATIPNVAGLAMRMRLRSFVNGQWSDLAMSQRPTVGNAWQKVTFDATIPAGATYSELLLINGFTSAQPVPVYWDDISIREVWAPFGEEWSLGAIDGAAGTAYTRITRPDSKVAAVQLAGGGDIWFTSADGTTWWPEPGAEDLRLVATSATTWTLTELDGTVTTFQQNTATKDFPVVASAPPAAPGASRYEYSTASGVSRLTRIVAPTEPGIDPQGCLNTQPARGCEVLELTYAASTTATTSTLGDFAGQVSEVSVWGYDGSAMAETPVAAYRYDDQGRLREVYDPRIEAAGGARLTTAYEYDTADRVISVTASGEAPWQFTYGTAGAQATGSGDWLDASTGRLLSVTRAYLETGTVDDWAQETNTTTVVYSVPLSRGAGGPYDLGADALDTWAQADGPTDATAVFGPETPPGVTTATATTPGSGGYGKATVHYLNSSGREVNTASPLPADGPVQGYIDTAEYDRFGNVTRTLDATNRLRALGVLSVSGTTETWGLEGRSSTDLAQLLDTRTAYSGDGVDVLSQVGPIQHLQVADTGQVRVLRPTTTTVYDEGKPDAVAYHLPTTVTTSGVDPTTGEVFDTVVMQYGYTPIDGAPVLGGTSGWVHKQATTVTVDAGQPTALTSQVIYDDKGRVIESRRPGASGADAATAQTVYYTVGANPRDATCTGHPEWAGQPCVTRAAGPVTGHDPSRMASQLSVKRVTGYNRFGSPTVVTESVTGPVDGVTVTQERIATTTYDAADRVVSVEITGTNAGSPIATTRSVYDAHGDVTAVQSIAANGSVLSQVTRSYDALGRLISYTDADGGTTITTYDRYGKPITETQTQGAQTIGTRTFAYDSTAEPRGFLTSIADSVAGTISATWGPDGQLETETLPGGITLSIGYDPARVPTSREYARTSDGAVIWRDSVVENHRGQWVQHESTTGTASYAYDRLGRLVGATDTLAVSGVCTANTYGYDTHTNRTSFTTATGAANAPCPTTPTTTITSTYDSADRLVSGFGGSGWTYDPLGRITSMPDGDGNGVVSNEFFVNDLIAAQGVPGEARVEWALDPLQRRSTYEEFAWVNDAWASSVTKVSHYATDSDEPAWILEDSTLPSDVTRFVSGVEGDLAVTTTLSGGRVVQLVDLHGDVVGTLPIADGASQATWSGLEYFRADEFGNAVDLGSGSASAGRYGWLGAFQRSGEALGGVILMGVRLYQPATGRFMSVDPVPGGSASAYDYCSADPVNCTDLGGTWGFGSILKVVAAVGEIASNIPGPIGAAAAGVSAVAYAAQGNTAKAIEMGITAAAALVGAGAVVRVAARAVSVARAAGQAVRAAPRLARATQAIGSAASRARSAVQRVTSVFRRSPVSCPINSFAPGTLVVLADGTLAPIETLDTGDLVLTTDPLTGETTAQPVITPIIGSGDKHLVDVVTDAGTWTATANHPIWVDGKGWTPAGELTAGDQLVGSTGGILVVQAMHDRGWLSGQTVYNLSVADTHTYYIASADGTVDALVHNCPGTSGLNYTAMAARHEAGTAVGGRSVFVGISGENAARVATRFGTPVPRPGGTQYVVGPFTRPVGLTPAGVPLHYIRATIRSNGNVHAWPAARGV